MEKLLELKDRLQKIIKSEVTILISTANIGVDLSGEAHSVRINYMHKGVAHCLSINLNKYQLKKNKENAFGNMYKFFSNEIDIIEKRIDIKKECECNCGYTCGRQCGLPMIECIQKHYKKDCEHNFEGWEENENGGSAVCTECGMTAMQHDMMKGP